MLLRRVKRSARRPSLSDRQGPSTHRRPSINLTRFLRSRLSTIGRIYMVVRAGSRASVKCSDHTVPRVPIESNSGSVSLHRSQWRQEHHLRRDMPIGRGTHPVSVPTLIDWAINFEKISNRPILRIMSTPATIDSIRKKNVINCSKAL